MLFAKNCRRIIADEIKGTIIRHRKRNNLTYTMRSKLATATWNFETVTTNSLGTSISYSLRAPWNGEENNKHCYNSRNPEPPETACSAGVKQPCKY